MRLLLRDLSDYLREILSHWSTAMSGVLGLVLQVSTLFFPKFFSGEKGFWHERLWWELLGIGALFYAFFEAWRRQRRLAENATATHKTRIPKLQVITTSWPSSAWS